MEELHKIVKLAISSIFYTKVKKNFHKNINIK